MLQLMLTPTFLLIVSLEFIIILNAQYARDPNRRLDHLEQRYELHSSMSSENFRDIWKQINLYKEKCCLNEANERHDTKQKAVKTGSDEAREIETLQGKVNLLNTAFAEEKKAVREMMGSIKTTLKEYNKSCVSEIERMNKDGGRTNDECKCSSKWIKIYENGPDGEEIFGDRSRLIEAVLTGSSVKILANKNYLTTVQNFRPVSGHLMAQALFHISVADGKFQNQKVEDDAYWWFVLASTTGHWYMSRYNVGEHKSRGDNEIRYGMEWFIRRPCETKPAVRILPDGTVATGSVRKVVSAIRNGFPIQITNLKSGYTFPADNLEVNNDHVAAQSLWHLSQKFAPGNSHMIFQENAYWYFTIWSTKGKKEVSRWTVGEHESRGSSSDSTLSDWFVDPCWEFMFSHSKMGEKIEGDKNLLIDKIRNGHKVRVVYKDLAFEPNVIDIIVDNNIVVAHSIDSLSKGSFDEFEENVNWIWRVVTTQGISEETFTSVGGSSSNNFKRERMSMAWFADKRNWTKKHDIKSSGIEELYIHIRNGADVRIQLEHTSYDHFAYFQPENVELSASDYNVTAMHVRHGYDSQWIFKYISTKNQNVFENSVWKLGKHEKISHTLVPADITWFISE